MSQFAKQTFDAGRYLAFRPSYTSTFYDLTFEYHAHRGGGWSSALDVGCGPGFIAQRLATRFDRVTAVDPSPSMVSVSLQPLASSSPPNPIAYHVASVEDLHMVPDASIDLVTAGQAAHWFTFPQAWDELGRVLKPRGTVAFWGYGEFSLPSHPSLSPQITHFMRSPSSLGPYWEQPGRSIVEALLDPLPFPCAPAAKRTPDGWEGFPTSSQGVPGDEDASAPAEGAWDPTSFVRLKGPQLAIRKTLAFPALEAYLRTASAVARYAEEHPGDDDVVGAFGRELKEAVEREGGGKGDEVEVEWPGVVMLAGKR